MRPSSISRSLIFFKENSTFLRGKQLFYQAVFNQAEIKVLEFMRKNGEPASWRT